MQRLPLGCLLEHLGQILYVQRIPLNGVRYVQARRAFGLGRIHPKAEFYLGDLLALRAAVYVEIGGIADKAELLETRGVRSEVSVWLPGQAIGTVGVGATLAAIEKTAHPDCGLVAHDIC